MRSVIEVAAKTNARIPKHGQRCLFVGPTSNYGGLQFPGGQVYQLANHRKLLGA